MTLADRIREAARFIREKTTITPRVVAVLGSGLGASELEMKSGVVLPYSSIPHMPSVSIPGHKGELIIGTIAGTAAAVFSGRVHLYEGYTAHEVTFGVRVMAELGCETLLVTNASGSTRPEFDPGTLVLITDHINLTGEDPTRGAEATELGTRFLGLTDAYDPGLRFLAHRAAREESIRLAEGVYAASRGPCYETPAEVQMLSSMGADLVGMSTALETIAARHGGMRVAGISCVTNLAAGIEGSSPDHEEVKLVAGEASGKLARLFRSFVKLLGETSS
ncbi:MAG: purine-nucleoside phosphorylase [Deltaproteobacteria bacterium]|nr:purine-nucleoside phosphorylase [Deltaproteobacteria bacterium]